MIREKICGIYQIRNLINGKIYIGSSADILSRWTDHRRYFKKGEHHSQYLQRAWNKYGEKNFIFEIIESVTGRENLLTVEQRHLDTQRPVYNMNPFAAKPPSRKGKTYSMTDATKIKLSNAHKNVPKSYEHRLSLSKAKKGRFGEDTNNSKLSDAERFEIYELYATGDYTQKELSDNYPVSPDTIGDITRNKMWQR